MGAGQVMAAVTTVGLSLSLAFAVAVEKRDSGGNSGKLPCYWDRPQSALIRDTVYLNGGLIGGTVLNADGNPVPYSENLLDYRKLLYKINLKRRFTQDSIRNISTFIEETAGHSYQRVSSGHLLANNDQFMLYGGVFDDSAGINYPRDSWASMMDLYLNNQTIQDQHWSEVVLDKVTRYVADGAYVNVPSENLSFIFGGSRGKNWGEIRGGGGEKYAPHELSNRLISFNFQSWVWENDTIGNIPPRTGGELVWLPTGQKGALVALGGSRMNLEATYLDSSFNITKGDLAKWQETGTKLMEEVHVYDVAQKKWYTQSTHGDYPPATSDSCSVVASSKDMTSHQIYVYGGYGGEESTDALASDFYDHVYVLSIPTFEWTKVYAGSSDKGRRGHRCHMVSDNRMMVVGGTKADVSSAGGACLSGGFLRVFNLNTLEFEPKYDPENKDSEYKVPGVISAKIGGNESGGADKEVKWDNPSLRGLLKSKYQGNVTNYWPFKAQAEPDLPSNGTYVQKPHESPSASGLPSFVPPLLGTILGLLVIITVLCATLFWLRRCKQQRRPVASDSGASTILKKHRTWSWLMNANADEKADFYAPESEAKDPLDGSAVVRTPAYEKPNPVEAPADAVVYEMPDTGLAGELPAHSMERRVTISDEVEEISFQNINQPSRSQTPSIKIPRPR